MSEPPPPHTEDELLSDASPDSAASQDASPDSAALCDDAPDSAALCDDAPDSASMRALLQASLPKAPEIARGEVLAGVQRALRKRSRGKYYANAWGPGQLRTSLVLIVIAAVLLLALTYLAISMSHWL